MAETNAANGPRPKKNDAAPAGGSLFRLGDHFDGVDHRVVFDGLELQQNVALFIGRKACEGLFDRALRPARFFEDVEVLQHRFSVAEDMENAAAGPAADRIGRAEVPLGESELYRITSRRYR